MNALQRRHSLQRPWLLPALFVVLLSVASGLRAWCSHDVGGDFLRYHRAGRLVVTGHADKLYDAKFLRTQSVYTEEREAERTAHAKAPDDFAEKEFKYDPAFAVLMAPLGALHPRPAWVLWGAWNGLMIGLTFVAASSLAGLSWRWAWIPFLVLLHATNKNQNLGQINPTAICGATGALWFAARGKLVAAGLAAAGGTAVKYLPAADAAFFAVKCAWRAVVAFLLAAAFLFWGLPALVLGPRAATDLIVEHKQVRMATYVGAAPADLPGHSIKSFVYRVFGGTRFQTGPDARPVEIDVSIAHADPEVLRWTVLGLDALVLLAALWAARGPLRQPGNVRGAMEGGALLAAIPLVSPEARGPHFLYLALPLAALLAGLQRAYAKQWTCRHVSAVLGIVACVLLTADSGTVFRGFADTLSAYCALGWAALAVFVALLLLLREARRSEAAPA